MSAWAWATLCLLASFLLAALGDLISEEIRGWLDLAPQAILRLAATQLDPDQRETIYHDEWLPELTYILRGAESRPITRLTRGTTYALGLLISARRVARHLTHTPPAQPAPSPPMETLRAALAWMPIQEREIFILTTRHGLSTTEIAAIMGLSSHETAKAQIDASTMVARYLQKTH